LEAKDWIYICVKQKKSLSFKTNLNFDMKSVLHSFLGPDREVNEGDFPRLRSSLERTDLASLPRSVLEVLLQRKICTTPSLGRVDVLRSDLDMEDALAIVDASVELTRFRISTCGTDLVLQHDQVGNEDALKAEPLGQAYKIIGALFPSVEDREAQKLAQDRALTCTLSSLTQKRGLDPVRRENFSRIERAHADRTASLSLDFPIAAGRRVCQIAFSPLKT